MSRCLILVLVLLMSPAAFAELTQAQLDAAKQAAIDNANAAGNIDLNGGGRPIPGEMGQPPANNGCVGSMNRPSLLGVQADMGPGLSPDTRGLSSRLGPTHPYQMERGRLDAQINGAQDCSKPGDCTSITGIKQKADQELRALYGNNPLLQRANWIALNWDQEANTIVESIAINEKIQAEKRKRIGEIQQTIGKLRADEPQINRDFWAKELSDRNADLAKLQSEMDVYQQFLPRLQQGAAKYKATATPLLIALKAAEKNVAAEAAKCP